MAGKIRVSPKNNKTGGTVAMVFIAFGNGGLKVY